MEKSVDSIGTCSLDVEASADLSDWSEISSTGTLHSTSSIIPSPAETHLPSYLSLACTVNGYSNTTNYNPARLSKSRDASPLRFNQENLTPKNAHIYFIQNDLLSPSNLVPLPTQIKTKMADNLSTLSQHHKFYKTSKTMTCINKETYSTIYSKDTIDAYYENGHSVNKFSTSIQKAGGLLQKQEFSNGKGKKSFIEQRVERLYGPGALAQGFFINKKVNYEQETMGKKSITITTDTNVMKQSTSSPTLPVLRHLRPEFRAQLPVVIKSRRSSEMQKSTTVPSLKEQTNGQTNNTDSERNLLDISTEATKTGEKDGHYFMKILQQETERLLLLADSCDEELKNPELSEDVVGKIRSASGKARLLVSQKMQQFKGLCANNITQVAGEAFPTTNEDLQGFWDMVMLQVDQVDALFAEIKALKANNWENPKPILDVGNKSNGVKVKRIINRAKPSAVNEEARKQREAERRKMIEARRKAMKTQNGATQKSIEIFVPESS